MNKRLIAAWKQSGLTQEEFGRRLRVTRCTVNRWLGRRRTPPLAFVEMAERLAESKGKR